MDWKSRIRERCRPEGQALGIGVGEFVELRNVFDVHNAVDDVALHPELNEKVRAAGHRPGLGTLLRQEANCLIERFGRFIFKVLQKSPPMES